ncbi:acyltransferase [Pontiella sulfatireligans]|uniref:dTDP-4-amino-4,6-dideoxy-D-glucose acyltransferase n=1 Tax=Pontiella sulfatireligans TaxID=2750658 RepID=A0A6C2UED1_9BACT|nr:acyltransferase [Pontiella sulfatireligans]VGO18269.1 dTDP-4-amino-4,6-dideoxy-D-glucose acyltransferase [Pontiella sulfatireligans]
MKKSFYSTNELRGLGLKAFGDNVCISRNVSIYNAEAISIGNHVRVDDFCVLSGGKGITIGSYIQISPFSIIYGSSGVVLEDYSGLSPHCTIFSESDDFSGNSMIHPFFPAEFKPGYIKGQVTLRKYVQVGVGSAVLPGIELGEGVAIGAHSLVTKACDPWGIYAGIPAKRIKERSRKLIELERGFRSQLKAEE